MMSRHRTIGVVSAAVVVTLLAAGGIYLRGTTTPVPVEDAVRAFRAATPVPETVEDGNSVRPNDGVDAAAPVGKNSVAQVPATATSETTAPTRRPPIAEGVYVYRTSGHDEVDTLGGSRHDYPSETTVTVRHEGSCSNVRWDVLRERWDERKTCDRGDRVDLVALTAYHEFFRKGDVREFRCEGTFDRPGAKPGDVWTNRCAGSDQVSTTTIRAVGHETLTIDGRPVEAARLSLDIDVQGEQKGHAQADLWRSIGTGLLLKEKRAHDSEGGSAVGPVKYSERYEITLASLSPRT